MHHFYVKTITLLFGFKATRNKPNIRHRECDLGSRWSHFHIHDAPLPVEVSAELRWSLNDPATLRQTFSIAASSYFSVAHFLNEDTDEKKCNDDDVTITKV